MVDDRRYSKEIALGKGSALVAAVQNGDVPVVNTLLAADGRPDFRYCDDTYTPLDAAAVKGHLDVLRLLIAHGADLNTIQEESGYTPLHFAALSDQAGAVGLLIEAGAYIEGTGNGVGTPLLHAARACSRKAMLTLLQHGADLGVQTVHASRGACTTPLHVACTRRGGLEDAVDLLLRWGADETAMDNDGRIPAQILDLLKQGVLFPVLSHCSQEEVDRVRMLLARAPADRTWRRRGWLVVLCSRAAKARSASRASGEIGRWRRCRFKRCWRSTRESGPLQDYEKQ